MLDARHTERGGSTARLFVWLVVILLLNSGYLLAAGDPSLVYVTNVLAHLLLGFALILAWIGTGVMMLRKAGRTPLTVIALVLMVLASGTGLALIAFGNHYAQRPVLWTHIASSFGAVLMTLLWFRQYRLFQHPVAFRLVLAVLALAVLLPATRPFWPQNPAHRITNPDLPAASVAGEAMGGAEGPFFPSAAATASGDLIPADYFLDSQTCGRAGCHPDLVAQWEASAHRFSSFNNQWYRKSIEYMQEVVGEQSPKWCAGCHDHALLFAGLMDQPVADFIKTPEAHAGLACVSCHSIVEVKNTMGNGGFVLEYPALHEMAQSSNPLLQKLHDFVVHVDPEPHRRAFLKPFHRAQPAEFCSSCHKVSLDEPVNHYRWVRGFNTYDNWQASGISGQGARSFYAPPEPQTCLTCHMPYVDSEEAGSKNGFIRSHRFPAANTALPIANQDSIQLNQTIDFLRNGALRVDIFAVSEPVARVEAADSSRRQHAALEAASTFAVGEEQGQQVGQGSLTRKALNVIAPLEDGDAVLKPGTSVRLDVVVRTLRVGHFFPTGTVDAQEAWLELKAVDSEGTVLLWSGWTDSTGTVDPSAHFYRNRLVDAHANLINKRNAWASRAVVYVNLIPPGAADIAHYRLQVPADVGDQVTITARLHYRKFDDFYNRFAYAGVRADSAAFAPGYDDGTWTFTGDLSTVSGTLKEIPTLPIVTMAMDSVTLAVTEQHSAYGARGDPMRWNDYGIGLLLEGDLKSAVQAFRRVTELDAGYADGWVNLARAYLQEGDLESTERALHEAEQVQPGFHKTSYFQGLLYKARGDYAEALEALEAVADRFPNDRVVIGDIGRVHYLNADPEAALPYFHRVLAIDPEDLAAHYNLMLIYRALGNLTKANAHQQRYLRFKEDETAQALARQYRQQHPHDNNEALPIHEHTGLPPER